MEFIAAESGAGIGRGFAQQTLTDTPTSGRSIMRAPLIRAFSLAFGGAEPAGRAGVGAALEDLGEDALGRPQLFQVKGSPAAVNAFSVRSTMLPVGFWWRPTEWKGGRS